MRTFRNRSLSNALVFLSAASLFASPADAAGVDRIFSFGAGNPASLRDYGPAIAIQPGGSFLLASQATSCVGCDSVRTQRFDAAGRPIAPSNSLWQGGHLGLAALPDGGFVAVTAFDLSLRSPDVLSGIGLHRLNAFGRPIGDPIVVAIDTSFVTLNLDPRIAVSPTGTVAVVWDDTTQFTTAEGLKGSFYDANLRPIAESVELSVPEIPVGGEYRPEVAFATDGTALVTWMRFVGPFASQMFGRRFDSTGHPLSEPFPISVAEPNREQDQPRLVARPEGGWWAIWSVRGFSPPPIRTPLAAIGEVRLVRLDADGKPVGSEQAVADLDPFAPFSAAVDGRGRLLVAGINGNAIVGRLFDRDGNAVSERIPLSDGSAAFDPVLGQSLPTGFLASWALSPQQSPTPLTGTYVAPTCLEGKSAVCLGADGRYAVEAAWRNGSQSGTAKPLPLAGNAATFGLRNVADHEVTVILSGPGARDLTFAATTGAELEIRVTDKTTGRVGTFTKPAGRFASQRFLDAIPSASSAFGEASPSAAEGAATPAIAPALGEPCVPTSRALCLLGGRFRAELLAGANPRPALAILRTDRSGTFAFPSAAETPLVVLTMTDGRAANGKFWVYLGGLSRAAYKVKITDLSTGAEKVYSNPVGRLESRADRAAF